MMEHEPVLKNIASMKAEDMEGIVNGIWAGEPESLNAFRSLSLAEKQQFLRAADERAEAVGGKFKEELEEIKKEGIEVLMNKA